jgi:hypothetical protein
MGEMTVDEGKFITTCEGIASDVLIHQKAIGKSRIWSAGQYRWHGSNINNLPVDIIDTEKTPDESVRGRTTAEAPMPKAARRGRMANMLQVIQCREECKAKSCEFVMMRVVQER